MSDKQPVFIKGGLFQDERGILTSCNDFDMSDVRRMYIISPASEELVRAWQAHKLEQKWFFCLSGSFEVKLILVDDFEKPSGELPAMTYRLESGSPGILYIPGGYANGFRARSENSSLLVYSSFNLNESTADDYRYPADKWSVWEK